MDDGSVLIQRWLKQISRWPKWVWGTAILISIVLLAYLVNPSQYSSSPANTADPLRSPTALAVDIFLKFGVVLGLIYLAYYFLRKWQGNRFGTGSRQLLMKETLHLSPRRSIHLVQAGNRVLLIGATDQSVSFLADIDTPTVSQLQSQPAHSVDFASILASSPIDQITK